MNDARNNPIDLTVYEDFQCPICCVMCEERDKIFAPNRMLDLAFDFNVPENVLPHTRVAVCYHHVPDRKYLAVTFRTGSTLQSHSEKAPSCHRDYAT